MNGSNNIFKTIQNPKVIICTIKYVVIICLLAALRYEIWIVFYLNWMQNETIGYIIQLLIYTAVEIINIQLLTAFIYMILRNKMKFKRFFSFMHFRYLKFNCLTVVTFALFFGGGTFALNSARFTVYSMYLEKRGVFYMFALFWLALSSFKFVFAYFRAMNPNENFKNTTKKFFDFIVKNIKQFTLFNIKFIPWIIGYIFLIFIFNKTDFDIVVYVMLNSCLYGLGILIFPCYVLGFHNLICSLHNKSEI